MVAHDAAGKLMITIQTSSPRRLGAKRFVGALLLVSSAAFVLPWGCSEHPTQNSSQTENYLPSSPASSGVRTRVDVIRAQFAVPLSVAASTRIKLLDDGSVQARFPLPRSSSAELDATVELPAHASGGVRLRDGRSGLAISFALEGAGDAPLSVGDGVALYAGAFPHGEGDLLHLVSPSGTEDFVFFEREPAKPELRYAVDTSGIAGLRLLSNTLEFVDASGAPRLRVRPPYVLDAARRRHAASLHVEGCAADTDPRAPWGRAVTPPGARSCVIAVEWRGAPVQYPALVDPTWQTTKNSMFAERTYHTATLLDPVIPASPVLIVGGFGTSAAMPQDPKNALSSAELYEPLSRTFAVTGSLIQGRGYHTATLIETATNGSSSWEVLIVGGSADEYGPPFMAVTTVEKYDSMTGTFSAAIGNPPVPLALLRHTATRFAVGQVLIAGGSDGTGQALNTAYIYTAGSTPTLTSTSMPMQSYRSSHAAVFLADATASVGDVLLTGGFYVSNAQTSGEIFNGTTGMFEKITGDPILKIFPSMLKARALHTATRLQDGRVLLAGGVNASIPGSIVQDSAEIFVDGTPATRGFAKVTIPFNGSPHYDHTATLLPAGDVVLIGGLDSQANELATVDTYCPMTGMVTPYPYISSGGMPPLPRVGHTATLVNAGQSDAAGRAILVAGGGLVATSTAELLSRNAGEVCGRDQDCATGHCVTGICCDVACTGACQACRASAKESNAANGTCDQAKNGTPTTVNCVDGTRTESACQDGASVPVHSSSCAPFQCNAANTDCGTNCLTSAGCDLAQGWCSLDPSVISVPDGCPFVSPSSTASSSTTSSSGAGGGSSASGSGGADGGSSASGSGGAGGIGGAGGGVSVDPCYVPADAGPPPNDAGGVDGGAGGAGGGMPVGTCVCKKPNGVTCDADEQCLSAFCVDGTCCNVACAGQCEACDVPGAPGICTTIGAVDAGEPPHQKSHMPCDGEEPCKGTCNGKSNIECYYPPKDMPCGIPTCEDGTPTSFACDDQHLCSMQARNGCSPSICDSMTKDCKEGCDSSEKDCDEDGICINGKCDILKEPTCSDDGNTRRIPKAADEPCAPFKCRDSMCLKTCSSVQDCQAGFGCKVDGGQCEPVPKEPPPLSASCSAAVPGRAASWPMLSVLLAIGLAVARSRRKEVRG